VFFSLIKGTLALGTYNKLFPVKTVNNFSRNPKICAILQYANIALKS